MAKVKLGPRLRGDDNGACGHPFLRGDDNEAAVIPAKAGIHLDLRP